MKKVVVTGMGILSAIGNGIDKVKDSLLNGVSGINRVVYDITSKPPSTIELE